MIAPPSVLIAEDDEGHATLVQRNMRRAGLVGDLVRLRDGQEVLDYLYRRASWAQRPTHEALVVVLDLNMPRLGGFEVLERIKRDASLAHIPIFVLTTTDNPIELDRCYALGAAACLVKPVDYGAFGDLVQRFTEFLLVVEMPAELRPDDVH